MKVAEDVDGRRRISRRGSGEGNDAKAKRRDGTGSAAECLRWSLRWSIGKTVELHMYKWAAAFKNSATAARPGTPQRRQYSLALKWSDHSVKAQQRASQCQRS